MRLKYLHPETSVVFLALYWKGPEPSGLADLLLTFDFLNHAQLGCSEAEEHLNVLLSAGLIEAAPGLRFALPRRVYEEFDDFRRRRRKGRFDDAQAFVRLHDWQSPPPRVVRITETAFRRATAAVD